MNLLSNSVSDLREEASHIAQRPKGSQGVQIDRPITIPKSLTFSSFLKEEEYDQIPAAGFLMVYYLTFFLSAEAAFILMAIREYLEDLLGLTEIELISGKPSPAMPQ